MTDGLCLCGLPRMSGESMCGYCVFEEEKHFGRSGFSPHGREPSERTKRADAWIKDNYQIGGPNAP